MVKFLDILQKMPRLWLELLAVTGLAILVIVMLAQGRAISSILPTMGLFAAATFRLMPSANRILVESQSLRYGVPAIDKLHQEFQLTVPKDIEYDGNTIKNHILKNEIVLSNIAYSYPDTTTPALVDISITIPQGKSIAFVGPSGSGKSTLIDLVLGLLTPSSGQLMIDGKDAQQHLRLWQDQIGYVPQSIYLTDDTLRRNIAFGLAEDQIDNGQVQSAIEVAQLEDFVAELPNGIESVVGERGVRLSGGQRQRIGIARALYHNPGVLVLDEATSALDNLTEQAVMDAIHNIGHKKTIILIAHRLSTVRECDEIYVMKNGKLVVSGTYDELFDKNADFRSMAALQK